MSSYDVAVDFGVLYDAIPAYAERPDVAFYVSEAARAGRGSTILELGCGTGRVTLPLARAGHAVLAIDASPAMLSRAREKIAAEPDDVRHRATLLEADARALVLDDRREFDRVFAPFRVLQHFTAVDDQLRCLSVARRRLAPGGALAFDVFNPNYAALLRDRSVESEDTPEQPMADGRFVRRAFRVVRVRLLEQVNEVELTYYVRDGANTQRVVQAFEMRWYTPIELEHLLARAGFHVDGMFGTFDRQPLRDDSPEIVVVAARGG